MQRELQLQHLTINAMEMIKKGNCLNFGNCTKADRKEIIELNFTEDFVCPECNSDLNEVLKEKIGGGKKTLMIVGTVVVIGIIVVGIFFGLSATKKKITNSIVPAASKIESGSIQTIVLNLSSKTLKVGEQVQLTATTTPQNASDKIITWESSDNNVATVSNGLVTAISLGIAEISASISNTSHTTCKINIENVAKTEGKHSTEFVPTQNNSLTLGYGNYKGEIKGGKANGMGTLYYSKHQLISTRDRQERFAESGDYLVGEFYSGEVVLGKLFDKNNNQKAAIIVGRPN